MKLINISLISLLSFSVITGCGGDAPIKGAGSNIPYLKANHLNYKDTTTATTPAPTKDLGAQTITWSITADTETDAIKLFDHIKFMTGKLETDKNPRPWDELFLIDAYMKTNFRYTTDTNRLTNTVTITKAATDSCAYQVISAHSDVTKGDFFAQGIIDIDYSPIAQTIINSPDCLASKPALDAYILARKKAKM